ncbi:MAG: sensor protein KdpD, partial [Chitinophagaceae bacterium]|nr:sensor protein KdpD [Chitinophagaceae bacterium]
MESEEKYIINQGAATKKGKLKIYIGMSAGVGKTYRMLQEAHQLLIDGVNVKIGYVET